MIDWNAQWELHAPNFLKGFAHVSLKEFGGPDLSYKMMPGPGFGDLSHPTTRLMLQLMPKQIDCPVIDIGCGSGVLSLAAKRLGAPQVIGIDIDEEALLHAKKNATLNHLNCFFGKNLPSIPENPLILMNMISSEQKIAMRELPPFSDCTIIVSGFPIEEKNPVHYGTILEIKELEGWKALRIERGKTPLN